jgi:hypothetical protein
MQNPQMQMVSMIADCGRAILFGLFRHKCQFCLVHVLCNSVNIYGFLLPPPLHIRKLPIPPTIY